MIKSLRLLNFKAFQDSGHIDIKPLTVLAGPNSGGKSSILQSLLLLKQTLDAPPDIDLSLDGQFLHFASFSDLIFGKPPVSQCSLSFTLGLETPIQSEMATSLFPNLNIPEDTHATPLSSELALSFRRRTRSGKSAILLDSLDVTSTVNGQRGPRLRAVLKGGRYRISFQDEHSLLPDRFKGRLLQTMECRNFIPQFFIEKESKKQRRHHTFLPLPPVFMIPFLELVDELVNNLEYLGPLREKPQRAYLHSGNPMTKIGDSGQYAAQILWIEKDRKINYQSKRGQAARQVTLIEAVNDAFVNLGLFQSVDVNSAKSMVYQILFNVTALPTRKFVTIADVGFGISQLLPVVVLALRSDDSSILMLEQPEIHLHPKLQANLADFLLTLTTRGRRIIVETHSDHFINRLRRRIAEDETDDLKEQVNILFIQPPRDEQGAVIDPLRIDRFGVIENWPPDFLPEAANEAEAIFLAGMNKRKGNP